MMILLMDWIDILASMVTNHPISIAIGLLVFYLLYAVITFNEMIIPPTPKVVPNSIRQVPGQKMPPNYPNGWIPILESRFLKPNQVKSVLVFGQELAVVRGGTGLVYVLDAYCPHLGANLAVGGTVHRDASCDQDCLRCPFHGWSFRMDDGRCTEIPYEEEPVNAKVKLWPSLEVNNVIFVWYHADDRPPTWHPDPIKEITTHQWLYRGRSEHLVNCHIQEIPENGADIAHLGEIHVDPVFLGSNLSLLHRLKSWPRLLTHSWTAQWSPCDPPEGHMTSIALTMYTKLFGYDLFTVHFKVNQIGPAYVVLRFQTILFFGLVPIEGVFLQFVKPISPMTNSIVHQVYTDSSAFSWAFGKLAIHGEARMLQRDMTIWNRKAFLSRPWLAKSEKTLAKYRRWYGQFYSEGSSKRLSLDW